MNEVPEDLLDQDDDAELTDTNRILEKIELTHRDIALFKIAHEHRYIVYNQIREAFWKNRSVPANACYKRVERLVKSGYLEMQHSGRKNLNCYLITPKSYEILQEKGLDAGLQLYEITADYDRFIDHDLKVMNLRILFRQLGLDSWSSERVLRERKNSRKIPDGMLNVRGKHIAIEFENRLDKPKKDYQKMISYYGEHEDYDMLFVIVDGHIKDWIVTGLDYDLQRFWIAAYVDLIKHREQGIFENRAATFTLGELV
jgi:hypothetical protein